jgi:3-oxoacyl-ACP reductase-like protein
LKGWKVSVIEATAVTPTGIITAASTLFIAITGLVAALTVFVPLLRKVKETVTKIEATQTKVDEVKHLVDGHSTRQEQLIADLTAALVRADLPVPVDQSLSE